MSAAVADIIPFAETPLDDGDGDDGGGDGDRLPHFIVRLLVYLADENAEVEKTVRRVVADVLRDMAAEEGTEE